MLHPLVGHEVARRRIRGAIAGGTLPQTLLVTGPAGVGKQRFALWLAQRLFCTAPLETGEPCGSCRECRLVLELAHPDLHWVVPVARGKATEPAKQVEELEESLAGVMAERRQAPLWTTPDGMALHAVAAARLLVRRAALSSVEGRGRVIILGDAERLAGQAGQEDAANALLKLLEEPPAGTVFVLTASEPRLLLPTIRSRAVVVRLTPLPDAEVRAFLKAHVGEDSLDERVRRAGGAIGMALRDDADEAGAAYRDAARFLEAALAAPEERFLAALRQKPFEARGGFTAMLDAMADLLGEAAREAAGGKARRPLPRGLGKRPLEALLEAQGRVASVRETAQGNVNPQLLASSLGAELAARL